MAAPDVCRIQNFLHCLLCLSEKPDGVAPRDYQSIEVGMFDDEKGVGLQVWCKRHGANVMLVELNGDKWMWHSESSLGVKET